MMDRYPSKEHFIQLVDAIQKVRHRDSQFSEVLSEYMGCYAVVGSHDKFIESVIEFTESLFGCCGKVEYYCMTLDFGRNRIRFKPYYANAGELYNALIASAGGSRSSQTENLDGTST